VWRTKFTDWLFRVATIFKMLSKFACMIFQLTMQCLFFRKSFCNQSNFGRQVQGHIPILDIWLPHFECVARQRCRGEIQWISRDEKNFSRIFLFQIILSSATHINKSFIYRFLYPIMGHGLLTSGGAKWTHRRKVLTPAFHFNILQQFLRIFR